MVKFQLTEMSDRLPPLSPFTSSFRLDPWQKEVLQLIDNNQSCVICAPTSSGKTVISTYVAALAGIIGPPVGVRVGGEDSDNEEENDSAPVDVGRNRVLFVVPTEPLVWQVAAHFSKHINSGSVALVTNQMAYCPSQTSSHPPSVVVGTPLALESAMTKIRGRSGVFERAGGVDLTKLTGGFDHYGWAVYDEVHSLDGPEGAALQRIIRSVNCNFLALSATIGNAETLQGWMEQVRGEQVNAIAVNAPPIPHTHPVPPLAELLPTPQVNLTEVSGRFINIQRHQWVPIDSVDDGNEKYTLQPLHPLAAVSLDLLVDDGGFSSSALAMTSSDSYCMWEAMASVYPPNDIADVHPHVHFDPAVGAERITLQDSKEYEDALKAKLEQVALLYPQKTEHLLQAFTAAETSAEFDIASLLLDLRERHMTPALVFHLNIFELIGIFRQLLGNVEAVQQASHPHYYDDMIAAANAHNTEMASIRSRLVTIQEIEDAMRDGRLQPDRSVDLSEPHPNFCFCPSGSLTEREFKEICEEVVLRDHFEGNEEAVRNHALMRALRRGIGFYVDDHHLTGYRMVVMRLALQGKLGVVLSDSSLAYGVNMPFRTCVFCGEMNGQLTNLMAQQMSGRSGRRGLDTQGHIVYAGMSRSFVQELMRGRIPDLSGGEPRYHSSFLAEMLSGFVGPTTSNQMANMPLMLYPADSDGYDFRSRSIQFLEEIGLIERCEILPPNEVDGGDISTYQGVEGGNPVPTPSGYRPRAPHRVEELWCVWEMRQTPAEGVLLGCLLPKLFRIFAPDQREVSDSEVNQCTFLMFVLAALERHPHQEGGDGMHPDPLHAHPFLANKPEVRLRLVDWENSIADVQAQIVATEQTIGRTGELQLHVPPHTPLDSTVFDVIITRNSDGRSNVVKEYILEVYVSLLRKLIIMHNCLMNDSQRYGRLANLIRKSISLVRYSSRELMHEVIHLPNIA